MNGHADFAAGLLRPERPVPQALHAADPQAREHRYAVYRNNTTSALIAAFAAAYPVLRVDPRKHAFAIEGILVGLLRGSRA